MALGGLARPENDCPGALAPTGATDGGLEPGAAGGEVGVSQSVISRFERGLAPGMTTDKLLRLSEALGGRFPIGSCPHPHRHSCLWPKIEPVDYEHPPAKREYRPLAPEPRGPHRRELEIALRMERAIIAGTSEPHRELQARITREVDEERARSA